MPSRGPRSTPLEKMTAEECWAELGEWLKIYPGDAVIAQYQGQSMNVAQLREVVASYRARRGAFIRDSGS